MTNKAIFRLQARRGQRGFTLLELMITVVVVAVLTAIAFPNLKTAMRRNNVSAQVNGLIAGLQFARSEAVTTRSFVALCPRVPGSQADDATCATDNSTFDAGWVIYTTATAGAIYDPASTTQKLLQVTPTPNNVSIRNLKASVITFDARGQVSSTEDETFLLCSKATPGQAAAGDSTAQVPGKQLLLAGSGRVNSSDLLASASCTSN